MVRTATPANIKNTFLTGVTNVRDTFNVTQHSELEPSSKKLISEYSFLASVVLLEGFLVAAYLRARSGNETRLEEYLEIFKNIANILCPSN